jgi:transcriptional regulator NrdR family protein
MVCIYCGNKTKVTNSRPQVRLGQTWRRRECTRCHAVFTSVEQVALTDVLRAKKRSGTLEHFERDKLFLSIYRSVDHLPESIGLARELTDTVLGKLFRKKPMSPIIDTFEISRLTAQTLKAFNAASSVRYLSFQADMRLANDVRKKLKRY